MCKLIAALLLALSAGVLTAAQQPPEPTQDAPVEDQKVIADPAEYNAYIKALNTLDAAECAAAFEAFLQKFPRSVMRPEALEFAMAARVQLDNEKTASIVRQIPTTPLSVPKPSPTPQERACKLAQEEGADGPFSIQELEFILQYRDSGAPCNKDAARLVWQAIQNRQRSARGEPQRIRLIVKALSATTRSIDAAITDENQKTSRADLRITMETPMTKPPAPGATLDVMGFISDYSANPFMFIMTRGEIPRAKP